MLAGGRVGAFLAGLAFMLPGFVLMLALSWFYVAYGVSSLLFSALLLGFQPAVMALIVRAIHRIGIHALTDRWLWLIAVVSAVLHWLGVNFLIVLLLGGLTYSVIRGVLPRIPGAAALFFLTPPLMQASGLPLAVPGGLDLFLSGLRAGLLTFGGAYTAIPFLQHDAVVVGGWMTNAQFLDGIALSGILPAPLIIFSTFIGFLGGGFAGAFLITAGIFLPSFLFTLLGHSVLERAVENRSLHTFLDGVTAGVIGLITVVAIELFPTAVSGVPGYLIFTIALIIGFRWKSGLSTPAIVLGGGMVGLLMWILS
jgi:chromate transporter